MHIFGKSIITGVLLFALKVLVTPGQQARADTIQAATANLQAVLGSAYQSERETFAGDQCVNGSRQLSAGAGQSGFSFDESMSEAQLSSELGFSAGARASYRVVDFDAASRFYNQALSSSFSISAAWESSYTFPSEKLIQPSLTPIGIGVRDDDDRWARTCGDQYVAEITRGAKLFFSVRIDFSNQQQKQEFQARFSVSGPVAGVSATLSEASLSFGQSAHVTLTAYQLGGDVSKLTQLFGGSDSSDQTHGATAIVQCQLGHFEQCADAIKSFLIYATDVNHGFPAQLAPGAVPGPAVLSYKTAPYTAINIYPTKYPYLDKATAMARQKLSDLFERQYRLSTAARRLLDREDADSRKALIEAEARKVNINISRILPVSETCYLAPKRCWNSVQRLVLLPIDEMLFAPASFGEICREAATLPGSAIQKTIEAIRRALGPNGFRDCSQLEAQARGLRTLVLPRTSANGGLSDLSPLATLTDLRALSIVDGNLSNIIQLSSLVNLKSLVLSGNRIHDISPLADMTELRNLDLSSNDIVDVSPLAGMHRLQRLSLADNQVADLSPLKSFPNLFLVDLRRNPAVGNPDGLRDFRARLPSSTLVLE